MGETQTGISPEQQKREAVEKLIEKFGGTVPQTPTSESTTPIETPQKAG